MSTALIIRSTAATVRSDQPRRDIGPVSDEDRSLSASTPCSVRVGTYENHAYLTSREQAHQNQRTLEYRAATGAKHGHEPGFGSRRWRPKPQRCRSSSPRRRPMTRWRTGGNMQTGPSCCRGCLYRCVCSGHGRFWNRSPPAVVVHRDSFRPGRALWWWRGNRTWAPSGIMRPTTSMALSPAMLPQQPLADAGPPGQCTDPHGLTLPLVPSPSVASTARGEE
jgi:hypothetical protein